MKIAFDGMENQIEIFPGSITTWEIENRTLFTRICQSLRSENGADAKESFSVWSDNNEEVVPSSAFINIGDPLELPWDNAAFSRGTADLIERLLLDDVETRERIETLNDQIQRLIEMLTFQIEGQYGFEKPWNLKQYNKAFAFSVQRDDDATYLENLITFLDFVSDISLDRVLVFVNLKIFLDQNDLEKVFDRVFFLGLQVLLLENSIDTVSHTHERKYTIDQHFLEHFGSSQSGLPPR